MLSKTLAAQYFNDFAAWLDAAAEEPAEWREAAAFGDVVLYLTAEEVAETVGAVRQALLDLASRTASRTQPVQGARLVQFLALAYPFSGGRKGV